MKNVMNVKAVTYSFTISWDNGDTWERSQKVFDHPSAAGMSAGEFAALALDHGMYPLFRLEEKDDIS